MRACVWSQVFRPGSSGSVADQLAVQQEASDRAAEEEQAYLAAVNAFYLLAYKLGKHKRFRELNKQPALPAALIKRMIVGVLRKGLRWATVRCREIDVLHRTDLERDNADWDKVSRRAWQ